MTSRSDVVLALACITGVWSQLGLADSPRWSFEGGSFQGWTMSGNLAAQPVCAPVSASRLRLPDGSAPARLGGDYWITPVDIGQDGLCRIDTAAGADSSSAGGEADSPEFTIDFPYLSYRIGGGGADGQARLELQLVTGGGYQTVLTDPGDGYLQMHQASWDLRDARFQGQRARLAVIDRSGSVTGILLDDVRASESPIKEAQAPVWGLADLHAHIFSHLAFGGRLFHGQVYAPGGMPEALPPCDHSHGTAPGGGVDSITPEFGHDRSGWPTFEGWPRYTTMVHQQAYVDWIRRAWEGGLRLIEVDATNNKFMAEGFSVLNQFLLTGDKNPLGVDDESAIRRQVLAAWDFVRYGPGKDFAAIARTPQEAREIIRSGKLALVLGIEADALGNFIHRQDLGVDPRDTIRRKLEEYYNLGIRHIIPIHLADNAFGSPAVYDRLFNMNDFGEGGTWLFMRDGFADGLRFNYQLAPGNILTWFYEQTGLVGSRPNIPNYAAYANATGLSPEGEILMQEMMRMGFLIDVDHMSDHALNRTLDLAELQGYPIMASHTGFRDLSFGVDVSYNSDGSYQAQPYPEPYTQDTESIYGTSNTKNVPNERGKSLQQLQRIRELGGIVGVGMGGGGGTAVSWRDRIPQDCDGTSKSFVQQYLYASEVLGGRGIAIGSDVNGFNGMPGPRFGTDACSGMKDDAIREAGGRLRAQAFAQGNGVRYDTPIEDAHAWRFSVYGNGDGAAYRGNEREVWEAIAYFKAGVDIDHFDPRSGFRWPWDQGRIRNFARGFAAADRDWRAGTPGASRPGNEDQLAAYDAYFGQEYRPGGRDRVLRVWKRWQAMEEGSNPPLVRDHAGERDFDVNLDGLAHYGMLPDYLQDARNNGLTAEDMAPLFHSAEDLIETWERAGAVAARIRGDSAQRELSTHGSLRGSLRISRNANPFD